MADLEVLSESGTYFRWDPYGSAHGADLAGMGYVRLEEATTEQIAKAVPGLLRQVHDLTREVEDLRAATKKGRE